MATLCVIGFTLITTVSIAAEEPIVAHAKVGLHTSSALFCFRLVRTGLREGFGSHLSPSRSTKQSNTRTHTRNAANKGFFFVYDVTPTCVWHDSFICGVTHSHVWYQSFMHVTWITHTRDVTNKNRCKGCSKPYSRDWVKCMSFKVLNTYMSHVTHVWVIWLSHIYK